MRQPTEDEVISIAIERQIRAVGKALPGTVVSYNAVTETCVVRPGVNQILTAGDPDLPDDYEELPACPNVPVAWPRARGFEMVGSLQAGDPVFLVCCDRDISGWRTTGEPSNPDDHGAHSWGSVVAIPGLFPDSRPFSVPSDAAALASRVEAELDSLRSAIETLRLAFNTHVHSGGNLTGSLTGIPTVLDSSSTPAVGDTGSTVLLLEE